MRWIEPTENGGSEQPGCGQLRERSGRAKFAQGTLLPRRLVKHGVPLVTVFWNGTDSVNWDTHYEETKGLKVLLPPTDRAFSALLEGMSCVLLASAFSTCAQAECPARSGPTREWH